MQKVIIESPFAGGKMTVEYYADPLMLGGYRATARVKGHASTRSAKLLKDAIKLASRGMAVRYARAAMNDCFKRGEAPIASHLLYTQDGVLDDDIPEEREQGIEAGLVWGKEADKTVVYTDLGISDGMKKGIKRAQSEGREIEYRKLEGWSND